MNHAETTGVIYVASGARYLAEAARSCASLKRVMPGIETALYTDTPADGAIALFDHVLPLPSARHTCGDKLIPLLDVPFDRAIFLDSDTYVARPIDDLFQLLDQFDFAIAHEPCRWGGRGWSLTYPTCPPAFCELNTGVFAFKKGIAWEQLVRQWQAAYEQTTYCLPRLRRRPTRFARGALRIRLCASLSSPRSIICAPTTRPTPATARRCASCTGGNATWQRWRNE